MTVQLLSHTPLEVAITATRTCWNSFNKSDNGGAHDKALVNKVANKYKHSSVIEHLVYSFRIQGISRACLQELARHRIASLSVKSTRYTLKEVKNTSNLASFLVKTGDANIDKASLDALRNVRTMLLKGKSNDKVKYCLPESFKTELVWTINARSLQNFLKLRSSKEALWEIRRLAETVKKSLPADHAYLF
jgi:thymidylate synthase (FAD)